MDGQEHPLTPHAAVLQALAEGRLEPEEWLAWWAQHGPEVQGIVAPGVFLRLKPKGVNDVGGASAAADSSQAEACKVLDMLGVAYDRSDRYHRQWRQAFDQFRREQAAATAAKATEFAPTIKKLAGPFPRFARFLKANIDEIDQCRPGLDDAALALLERNLGVQLPGAYRTFLSCARGVVVGDTLQLTCEHPFVHDSTRVVLPTQGMVCIGEYWLDADGDQVLFDLRDNVDDDPPVLYYDHARPAVRTIASSFTAWIEALPRTLAA